MNFFRLRFLNTLLLFLIGIVVGFILKERFYPSPKQPYSTAFQGAPAAPAAEAKPEAADSDDGEMNGYQQDSSQDETAAKPAAAAKPRAKAREDIYDSADNGEQPIVIESDADNGGPARPKAAADQVLRDSTDRFFRNPGEFSGRELEMKVQMITAKRSQRGWRLNFVYTGPDKQLEYLYVDDAEVLGDKPDLRIGYVYKVRFRCGGGSASSGNSLSSISATGDKAAWATGLSAVE